ncbi:IS1634 family transposase, partial [Myxococcota bacterium]
AVRYYQLAENTWDATQGCAVARVVYHFGRADQVDPEMLRRLAASILQVTGDDVTGVGSKPGSEVKIRRSWPYGGVWVIRQLWEQLEVEQVLLQQVPRRRKAGEMVKAIFAMVANRALVPYSKLHCWEQWLTEEVFQPDLWDLNLPHLYFGMDLLESHKAEVEKGVFFAMADLMGADVDVVFYDTTSLNFEIDEEDESTQRKQGREYVPSRKRGYAKNGRDDVPQIVIGLAVTRDGLPVRSWVFPGNTSDVSTVDRVKKDLRGWRLGRCVFVGDAGVNSKENRRLLALGGGQYILACKMRAGDEVTKEVITRGGRYQSVADNLRVKEVVIGDGERRRRYVVCHNPREEERQRKHRARLMGELEAELDSLQQIEGHQHSKRVCELRTSKRFGRYLRTTAGGLLEIDRSAVKDAERYDGQWVTTSNDDTLSPEDMALGYKQLMRVEQCWRQLKSGLRLRPVFHYRPWRIQAHVSLTVLGLLLERIAEIRVGDTWRNIRYQLNKITVVEYEHAGARIHQTSELTPEQVSLLKQLKVALPPKLHSIDSILECSHKDRATHQDG